MMIRTPTPLMSGIRYFVCVTIALLFCGPARGMQYKFRYYNDTDGLSSNTIQCLYQDSKGYIWVGTSGGLDRFNSYDFTNFRYDYRLRYTIENNCIYSICGEGLNDTGRLWVGTSNGVYVFDSRNETFTNLPLVAGGRETNNVFIYSLATDAGGNMWIGTLGMGLFRYSLKNGTMEHYTSEKYPEALSSNAINKVMLDNNNNIWVVSGGQLISRYNPENNSFSSFRIEDRLKNTVIGRASTICQDSFGDILIGGYSGELYKFDMSRLNFTCYMPPPGSDFGRVRALVEYSPGLIMMGTENGLVNFDIKNRHFDHVDDGTSNNIGRLSNKFIHAILKDRDGGIWIGTYFGGINYLSPLSSMFSIIEPAQGCGRVISKMCEDPDGSIWIGSDDAGLSIYDPLTSSYRKVVLDSRQPALNIHALLRDGEYLWVGTYGRGLYRMRVKDRSVTHFTQQAAGVSNLDVYSAYRDSRGRLWFGTKKGITVYDDHTGGFKCLFEFGLNYDVVDIKEDIFGNIWFASLGMGLVKYDYGSNSFACLSKDDKYGISHFVSCLLVENENIWFGTHDNGLYRYNIPSDELEWVFDGTSYANCAVFQLLLNSGDMWLTTNKGLLKYNFTADKNGVQKFTSEDGLLANIFNANSGIKSSTGHIYLGCNIGINRFYPYDFTRRENSARLAVVFTGISLFNQPLANDGNDSLAGKIGSMPSVEFTGENLSFTVDFIALNFSSPLRTTYRYKLENFDKDWNIINADHGSGIRHVSYTNLPPAGYRFIVSAANGGEQFGEEAVLELTVRPPFWMTKTMKTVNILLVISLLAGMIYYINRNTRRKHNEQIASITRKNKMDLLEAKVNMFTEVANEIRIPVSLIAAPVHEVSRHPQMPEDAQDDLGIIKKNCGKLLSLVDQILSLRSSESEYDSKVETGVDIGESLKNIAAGISSEAGRTDVKLKLHLPDGKVVADICVDYFTKIAGHIISNAYKYADSRIDIRLVREPAADVFILKVRDDGAGVQKEDKNKILKPFYRSGQDDGMANGIEVSVIRSLAAKMGATIEVGSISGEWSEFVVCFPVSPVVSVKADNGEDSADETDVAAPDAGARASVMLIDTNPDSQDFLSRHLSATHKVICKTDGKEALESLHEQKVSVVVYVVPASGIKEVAKFVSAVKSDVALNHIPVVVVSSDTSAAGKIGVLNSGADVFLENPVTMDLLNSQIWSLIDNRRHLRLKFSQTPYMLIEDEEDMPSGNRFMDQVNQYISDNISDSGMGVDDIAAAVNTSRSLFFSRIKEITGMTPNEYLRSTRLKLAAELIAASNDLRITEICYMVGFSSTSYFAKCFAAQFGMLPNEFMEKYRKE